MEHIDLSVEFEPAQLKSNAKNEAFLVLKLKNKDGSKTFWCECDVSAQHPLSLAHDKQLELGRTRIGIVTPGKTIEKKVRVYTRPNNFAGSYGLDVTVYAYDEEGVIAERREHHETVECV